MPGRSARRGGGGRLTWKIDGADYAWERPISTQQSGFVSVTQSRTGCRTRSAG